MISELCIHTSKNAKDLVAKSAKERGTTIIFVLFTNKNSLSHDVDRMNQTDSIFINFYYLKNCNMLMSSYKPAVLSYPHLVLAS
jgi:hypothetical protein